MGLIGEEKIYQYNWKKKKRISS